MPITSARARVLEGELDAQRTVADVMVYPGRAEVDGDHVASR
jgi:hypothetical protein